MNLIKASKVELTLDKQIGKGLAEITGIRSSSDLTPKLLEMGLYKGKKVKVLYKAPLGDPIAVKVGEYVLSLRLDEAKLISIRPAV